MVRTLALLSVLGAFAPAAADAQGSSTDDLRAEAEMLFGAGVRAYEAERYEAALGHFERSYALVPDRSILFNMARSAERAGNRESALRYYRQLAASSSDEAEQAELEESIARTERLPVSSPPEGDGAQPPSATPEPVAPPQPPDSTTEAIGWALVGLGAAAAVVGAVLLGIGIEDAGAINGIAPGTTAWRDVADDASRAEGLQVGGLLTVAVGLGVIGAGAGLISTSSAPPASASVQVRGRF